MEDPKDNNNEEPKERNEEGKINEDQKEPIIEGELIYNEEKGNQDMEKLFNDDEEREDYDTYEIEFKIFPNQLHQSINKTNSFCVDTSNNKILILK